MDYIFFNNSGAVLFVRNDIEMGQWTQEEYTVNMTFPYVPGKVIAEGQRVAFRDPATDSLEYFEIRNVQNTNPDGFQQFTAEHIVIAELTYEHINTTEITDKTPAQALSTVLTGTLWAVGNSAVSAVNSVDISRGDVWQAVKAIEANYNVYITPRVVVNAAGFITGRYLDITDAQNPVFRGVRLSIDANMLDDTVIYDDSDVYTALYGYGGSVDVPQTGGQPDKTEELTFKDIVWTQTAQHPAKPAGQTYIEDPAKTALYGHNGRPRFGYYQNSNIKDANTLLQKTWETLQNSKPKMSISGTVVDYYRLGYGGQPVRLHDKAIVEVSPTGEVFALQVIRNTVDLVDPTATRPEIGDYIPNIIYINRQTNERATGGGGGGRHGQTNIEHEDGEFFTEFIKTQQKIGMVVGTYNGGYKIRGGEITVAINDDGGTTAKFAADTIDIDGLVDALVTYNLKTATLYATNTLTVEGETSFANGVTCIDGSGLDAGYADVDDLTTGTLTVGSGAGAHGASWQTAELHSVSVSAEHAYLYGNANLEITGRAVGRIVLSHSKSTIHYLGY